LSRGTDERLSWLKKKRNLEMFEQGDTDTTISKRQHIGLMYNNHESDYVGTDVHLVALHQGMHETRSFVGELNVPWTGNMFHIMMRANILIKTIMEPIG
jgi:hypothetical protein